METHACRERHCWDPATDIVQEHDLQIMLGEWKNEFWVWLHPETLQKSWKMSDQQWHQFLRKAFRFYLFQIVEYYEITVCGLIAPLNIKILKSFRLASEDTANTYDDRYLSKDDDTGRSDACIENFGNRLLQSRTTY